MHLYLMWLAIRPITHRTLRHEALLGVITLLGILLRLLGHIHSHRRLCILRIHACDRHTRSQVRIINRHHRWSRWGC